MERRLTGLITKAASKFKQSQPELSIPTEYQEELDSIQAVVAEFASIVQGTTKVKKVRLYNEVHPFIELVRGEGKRENLLLTTQLFHDVEEATEEREEREVLRVTAKIADSRIAPHALYERLSDAIQTPRYPIINIFDTTQDAEFPILQWTPRSGLIEYHTSYAEDEMEY
jgi:hypothetical protein